MSGLEYPGMRLDDRVSGKGNVWEMVKVVVRRRRLLNPLEMELEIRGFVSDHPARKLQEQTNRGGD